MHGVDLFFVLSGFLITGILFDARQRPEHYFRNFYVRRTLRIFPLYYFVLAVLFLVVPRFPVFHGPTLDVLLSHQGWAWLYAVNVFNALQAGWALPYIDHFWSLAVEEQFYLVWPLVIWSLGGRPRATMLTCAGVAVGAVVAQFGASLAGVGEHALYVLTPFRLDGLALGGFLAVLARQPGGLDVIRRWVPRVVAAALVVGVARVAWVHASPAGLVLLKPLRGVLIVALLACVLMAAVTGAERGLLPRFFASAPMRFLGKYSYGLYVYHHFFSYWIVTHGVEAALTERLGSHALAVAVQSSLGAGASVALAWLSYELMERRFIALKDRFEGGRARPAPAAVPLPATERDPR
jgi:peptidoglycan/LPS O-acetylase OafA/YrhL